MRLRILTSILLMIGFYVLAIGIAFGLLAAVYYSVAHDSVYILNGQVDPFHSCSG